MLVDITCTINGRERNLAVEATELLWIPCACALA